MKLILENWREYLNEEVQQTDEGLTAAPVADFSDLGAAIKAYHEAHPEPENDMAGFEIISKHYKPFNQKLEILEADFSNSIRVGYKNALKSGDEAKIQAAEQEMDRASDAFGHHIAQGLPKITQDAFRDAQQSNIQFGRKALNTLLGMIAQREEDLKQLVQHKSG